MKVIRLKVIRLKLIRLKVIRLKVIRLKVLRQKAIRQKVIRLKVIRLKVIRQKAIRMKVIRPPGGIRTHNCPIPIYFFCPTFVLHFSIFLWIVLQLYYNLGSECPTKSLKKSYICSTMSYNFILKIL